jgi:NAD(P)-dependent dehydrogenase (short-subunit alcohol dehydrogenase family)
MGPLALADTDAFAATMQLNYIGTFLTLKHSTQQMAKQGGGSFIGCSSHAGQDPMRYLGADGAAKAGLDHLCRVAADEMGRFNVRVNSIQPGIIATELMGPITAGGKLLDDYLKEIPLGRVGEPEEIADMVRFLVGPESKWITGQAFAVDGGQNLRRGADYGEMLREFGPDPLDELAPDA